jgi:hypothetical protein
VHDTPRALPTFGDVWGHNGHMVAAHRKNWGADDVARSPRASA